MKKNQIVPANSLPTPTDTEKWKSSENNREIHFFIKGTQHYVAGFNPEHIDELAFKSFMEKQGFKIKP